MDDYTHAHTLDRWRDNGAGVFFSVRFGGGGTPFLSRLKPDAKERKMRGWIAVMKEWEVGS